ncbi:hypothetical protein [Nocardia sp. NPDC051570]|uniref:hypothetical protein n=1 Tax=Nocardia sp. NPDC051570 TaxID=3364324 RepID=UPI003795CEF6
MVLLAPEARRLVDILVLDRPVGSSITPYPFRTVVSRRVAAAAQLALCLWLLISPPLYGIWSVSEFTKDQRSVPPLLTDETRWQRIVFDQPGVMQYQRMDGTLVPAQLHIDTQAHRLELQTELGQEQSKPLGAFTFQQSAPDLLSLDGELEGHPVTVTLERFDENRFPQRSRGFRWIQDHADF